MRAEMMTVLESYGVESKQSCKKNWLAAFIRKELPDAVRRALGAHGTDLLVEGHPGQGSWTETPWVGMLNPAITHEPTEGAYACYLFRADMSGLVLSIQLGTERLSKELGSEEALRLITMRVRSLRRILRPDGTSFDHAPIRLQAAGRNVKRAKSYEYAHVIGKSYDRRLPDDDELATDARQLIQLSRRLVGIEEWASRDDGEDTVVSNYRHVTPEEHARYIMHRKLERNGALPRRVKMVKGLSCEACEFNFERYYGKFASGYIEAHHRVPLSTLPRDRPVPLDPREDFSVLCANCHRAIHRSKEPLSVEELRERIRSNQSRCQDAHSAG